MFNNASLADFIYDPKKDLLGEGKHGYVYKVKCKNDNRIYALKIVKEDKTDDEQIKNIIREYTIMSNIKHPNIEICYGFFKEKYPIDNVMCNFFILEFIKGENLTNFIKKYEEKKENIEQKLIISILKGIANGLSYLHKNKILHRDLTTDNIMIEEDSKNIKITDFGISALYQQNIMPNQDPMFYNKSIVGRSDFIGPEIFDAYSKKVLPNYDFKIDIFSLGITMFNLMTFCFPSILKYRNLSINYADAIDPKKYDKKLINFVMKMLEKEPKNRPSCEEINNCLDSIEAQIENKKKKMAILKNDPSSRKSCFSCITVCLSNIEQIYNYIVENKRNRKNKNLIKNLFSVINAFITVLEESKKMKTLIDDFIYDFIYEVYEKITTLEEEKNITPKIIFQSLFNYFLMNLPNIFVYNNIKGHELYEARSQDANNFFINQTIEKYMKQYKNIFVNTFYFLVLKKYKCPKCNFIIKQDMDIEFDIDFNNKGNIKELLSNYFAETEYSNEGKNSIPCNQCGIMQKKIREIKSIYIAPEVIVFHFNNNVILENYIDIVENREKENIRKFELKSIFFRKKTNQNENNYEIAIKDNNEKWIYYTNNGFTPLSLNEIIKKEGICTALYSMISDDFSLLK